MMRSVTLRGGWVASAVATMLLPAVAMTTAGAQQPAATGTITGRVTERGTGAGVPAAQVFIVGTNRGAQTAENGSFRILAAPTGSVQVRVRRLGYEAATQTVTVPVNGSVAVDFTIGRAAATTLEQVTVTATGAEQRARESGNVVTKVTPGDVPLAAVQNTSQLLQGRAAGVIVTQSGGASGSGARVRIRGGNSLSLSNEPLVIIDGIRINNDANSSTLDIGGQTPSRLNDLKPEDIEAIEILKGPAATGLYGTQAANGVIQVTTKRGLRGQTRWNSFVENGAVWDPFTYPANTRAFGPFSSDPADGVNRFCTLGDVATGGCVRQDSLQSFNPLEDERTTPFRTGRRQRYGLSAGGGGDNSTYYVSGDFEQEKGIYASSGLTRVNLRSNVTARLARTLDAAVNFGYLNMDNARPSNDNNDEGLVSGGFLGRTIFSEARQGYLRAGPNVLNQLRTTQTGDRAIGSGNLTWKPATWLTVLGTTGLDIFQRDDEQLLPPNTFTAALFDSDRAQGRRFRNRYRVATYTANASANASFSLPSSISSTTQVGLQFQRDNTSGTDAAGYNLLAGSGSLGGANARFQVDETDQDTRLFGALVSQQFGWRDKLFVSGSVRGDDNSAFGQNVEFVVYPSANVSWVVSEESFFPKVPTLSSLRLRAAIGQSGQRPGQRSALRYFSPVAVTVGGQDVPGFTIGNIGNVDLRPEITTEAELGFDAAVLGDRLQFEATYFSRRTNDQLVQVPIAPSVGTGPGTAAFRTTNIGTVTNKGFEALLTAKLVQAANVGFDVTVNFSTLANHIVAMRDTTPILIGIGGASQAHRVGYPAGGYFQRPYTFQDANNDRIIDASEVTLGGTNAFVGNPLPKRSLAVQPNLTLGPRGLLRLGALVDYRGGWYQYNSTAAFRCGFFICDDLYRPGTPLEDQARAQASLQGTDFGYMEKADFVKLREVTLTVGVPTRILPRRIRDASLTLAGRNLALWSKYSGLDPEMNGGGQANWSQYDFLTQPPARVFSVRLNANF